MSEVTDHIKRDTKYIQMLRTAGAQADETQGAPAATVGIFASGIDPWEPGKTYKDQYSLFRYDGKVGFTRQAGVLAQAHQPPFSAGMESVYGVRPEPDLYGVYPYIYNMAATVGMLVREGNKVYRCVEDIELLIWPPSQVLRYFVVEDEI